MAAIVRYAWFVLVFNVITIVVGAFVRATGSGAGCGPSWPTCQGEVLPELEGATTIEFSHRVISGVALILVAGLFIWVRRTNPKGEPARLGVMLSAIAIVGEALIGALIVLAEWVADDASVARAISVPAHLVNTLFLLAALTLTVFWLSGGARLDLKRDRALWRWILFGGVAIALIAASGAITALADTLFPDEPFAADFSDQAHFLTRLRILHPILAVVASAIGWWASARSGIPRSVAARSLPFLVGAMLITGSINVYLGVPLWMQLLHLALADALWIAYVMASAQALEVRDLVSQSAA